jgi:penicillin-binding protein 1C
VQPPRMPTGVVTLPVSFDTGREAPRPELFLAGTEQPRLRASAQMVVRERFGIFSPRDGSVFALDPDMPPSAQQISFEGERGAWVLDGRRLGVAARRDWAPWPGRHELALLGRDGRVIQTVRFEVRGASLKAAAVAPRSGG